jgi:hypothetical protein
MEMRLRSRRGIVPRTTFQYDRNMDCSGTGWSQIGQFAVLPESNVSNETMLDNVIPDFHKRVRQGEVFFNLMSREKVTVSSSGSDYHIKTRSPTCPSPVLFGEQRTTGDLSNFVVPNYSLGGLVYPQELTALGEDSIADLLTQLSTEVQSKRGRSDSDLWESLAEYKQALDLLGNPLTKIAELQKRILANGGTVLGRKLLKEVSDGYLLYRYGIVPLMNDVKSIVASLAKVTGKQRKTTRAFGSLTARSTLVGHSDFDTNNITYTHDVVDTIRIRAMSLDEVDLSFGGNLGFSTKGLITLPYELMTYSFVADWFANIGDFIGASVASLGYNQLISGFTSRRVTSNAYTWASAGMSSASFELAAPFNGQTGIVREITRREPLYPAGVVIKSDFKFDQITRVADAIGLIANRFTKVSNLVGGPRPNLSPYRPQKAYANWAGQPGIDRH